MRLPVHVALLLSLVSCEPRWVTPPIVKSPDGKAWWYDITCAGGAGGLTDCMYIAAHFCERGYDIVDGSQGRPGAGRAHLAGFRTPATGSEDELLVQCKGPDAESP